MKNEPMVLLATACALALLGAYLQRKREAAEQQAAPVDAMTWFADWGKLR